MKLKTNIRFILIVNLFIILISGCAAKRNTSTTRAYHELTTRYNIYYNAERTYNNLIEEQQNNITDNWYKLLTIFPVTPNKKGTQTGGPFDVVIEKTVEAIQKHSISSKPIRDPSKAQSSEYRQWLRQEEFNPFLKNVWLLMGKAYVQNGDYENAISVFTEIVRLYPDEIDLISEAQIWMMRCYSEMKRTYDAENMKIILSSRKLPENLNQLYTETYTDNLLLKNQYNEALPYIKKLIDAEKNFYLKKRLQFIVGQIYIILDDKAKAFHAFEEIKGLRTPHRLNSIAEEYQALITSNNFKQLDSVKLQLQRGLLSELNESPEKGPTLPITNRSDNLAENVSQWKAFQLKNNSLKKLDSHSKKTENVVFTSERDSPHRLLLQSVGVPLNKYEELNNLLFATANFNFSEFKLRTFNLSPIHMKQGSYLCIEPFYSYDDAFIYLQQLKTDSIFNTTITSNIIPTIISEDNLNIARSFGSLNQYKEFRNIDEIEQIEKNVSLKDELSSGKEIKTNPIQSINKSPETIINKQEVATPEKKDDRIDPDELKRELERKAEKAIKQSETVSDKMSRDEILIEREKIRKLRFEQREQKIKERTRKREAALKAREKERKKKIREQELRQKGVKTNY